MRYIGRLGGGSKVSIRLSFEGFKVDLDLILKENDYKLSPNYDYYTLVIYPAFTDDMISPKHKDVRIAAKSALLKVTLSEGYPKSCLPKLQEDQHKNPVEYEYYTETSSNGSLSFIPLRLGTEIRSSLKLLSKFELSKTNTYCYSIRSDVSAEWRFELRQSQSFLVAQKETLLVIEVPKGVFPKGSVELSPDKPSYFKNGEEIVGFWDRVWLKITGAGLDTSWYSPIICEFELTPPPPWSAQIRQFHRAKTPLPAPTIPPDVLKIIEEELDML